MISRTQIRVVTGFAGAAIVAAAVALLPVSAHAAPTATDPSTRVIILLKAGAGAPGRSDAERSANAAAMAARQRPVQAQIDAAGGRVSQHYSLIDGLAATVPSASVATLRARSDVAAVLPDHLVRIPDIKAKQPPSRRSSRAVSEGSGAALAAASGPQPLPHLNPSECPTDPAKPLLEPEALTLMRADSDDPGAASAARYATGAGVRVGVIANAVDPRNPDLIRANGTPVVSSYVDFAGTGTGAPAEAAEGIGDVASIAAQGRTTYDLSAFGAEPAGCTIRVRGVAPGADVVAIKALDGQSFYDSSIVESIDYAVTVAHVDVLNESLADDPYPDTGDDPVSLANAAAVAAGVTITVAAGDAGANAMMGPPASQRSGADGVISVGATTQLQYEKQAGYYRPSRTVYSGDIANLSTYGVAQTGRTVDALAPGYWGWSLCTDEPAMYLDCPDYPAGAKGLQSFAGTSESAPLTAGVAALVIQRYRLTHHGASPTPRLVKQIITSTADDIGAPAQEQGSGQVDALRAVQLAGAVVGGSAATTSDVLASPTTRTLVVGQNAAAHTTVRLTNPSGTTRHLVVSRRAPRLVSTDRYPATVPSDFFTAVPFPVARGTDRLAITAELPAGSGDYPELELIDPNGNVANETVSEGLTNTLILEADHPLAGAWQLFVITYAYTGPVGVTVRSYRNVSTELTRLSLPPQTARAVTVPVRGAAGAGDDVFALTVTDAARPTVLTSVPIVVRTTVSLPKGVGSFGGSLNGGNGRSVFLSGSATVLVAVPSRSADLHVAIHLDHPGQHVDAYLVAPTGDAIDQQTTLAPGSADPTSAADEVDLTALHPRAGWWRVVLGVNGPLLGDLDQLAYTGRITLGRSPITATGLPTSAQTTLTAGVAHHVIVHVSNPTSAPHAYVVDPRLAGSSVLTLAGPRNVQVSAASPLPVASVSVPPQTSAIDATMTADRPLAGSVAPNNFSFAGSNSDPEVYDVSATGRLHIVIRSAELANGPWLELPVAAGPFGASPITPFTVRLQASIRTRSFDGSVTSATGDPWPAAADAGPEDVHPVVIAARGSADIAVTITPTAAAGSVVRGTLYVDTWDARTGVSGQQAAIPYAYTVG